MCHKEALKYERRKEFEKCNVGAYHYAQRNKILDEICGHMKKRGDK